MSTKRQITEHEGVYFITVTCYEWLPLFELTSGYDMVYKWFDHLKSKGHYITGYVIMPNHLHALLAFTKSDTSINTIIGTTAKLYVWSNTGDLVWSGAPTLPVGSANENWITATFTIPANVTQIKVGVRFGTPAVGHTAYINRVALYKTDWEYQYFLTDQLGSPRVVLGTTPSVITYKATMETENFATEGGTNGQFLNLNQTRYSINPLANQTPGGNEAITMNNAYRIGPAKSLKVLPGDNIDASVYSYWTTSTSLTQTPFSTMSAALITAIAGGVTPVIDGINAAYTNTTGGALGFLLAPFQGSTRPSAFINYILFDEAYKPIEAKSTPVGATAGVRQLIALPTIAIKETGFLIVYLSYDNESTQLVYFDDLTISVTESPVVQVNNYYPYGLVAMEWVREGETDNNFLFQGKELIDQTGWHDFGARMYAGDLGRWFATDPANQFSSPFTAMGNNPVMMVDPDGEIAFLAVVGIFAAVNLAADAIRGDINSFEDGAISFGLGALQGALAAAGPGGLAAYAGSGSGLLALGSAVAGQVNVPVYSSDNFNLSISPSLSAGSTGTRLGANVFASATIDNVTLSGGYSVGRNFSATDLSGKMAEARWSSIASGNIGFNTPSGTYSYGLTHFGGNYSQNVGSVGYSNGRFSATMENDIFARSGDKYRTAAFRASYQVNDDLAITGGFKLFTSASTGKVPGGYKINGRNRRLHTENSPVLRNGIAYGGVNYRGHSYQFGRNSEVIRAGIQNGWHNVMPYVFLYRDKTNVHHFQQMGYAPQYYSNFGTYNPFTGY